VRQRAGVQDAAVESVEDSLTKLADNLARRLAATLGVDPDSIVAPDGDDGRDVGKTAIERRLAGLGDGDRLRAAVLSTQLLDVEELVEAAGLDLTREQWRTDVAKLAGVVESGTQGIAALQDRILDNVASEAALGSLVDWQSEAMFGGMRREAAVRILDSLRASAGLMTNEQVARTIANSEPLSIGQARTEARTRIAEADRFVALEVQRAADPDGDRLILAYLGPDDRITRPFCDRLVGKAFSEAEFEQLDNAQTPSHPRIAGGGYNCRHLIISVPPDALDELGLTRGTPADIAAANAAAIGARKPKAKGTR
jgi:hypothetical protein